MKKYTRRIDGMKYHNLANIEWKIVKGPKRANIVQRGDHVDNIITFDIECSTAYEIEGRWVPFDKHDPDLLIRDKDNKYSLANKASFLYVWQVCVREGRIDHIFLGRTWEDFKQFLSELNNATKFYQIIRKPIAYFEGELEFAGYVDDILTNVKSDILNVHMWIHNLSYEFQNLLNVYTDWSVFARQAHKPMKAQHMIGDSVYLQLHDTVILSGMTLKKWGEASKWETQKLDEDPDYYFPIRTPRTKLTYNDIKYSVNDVISLACGVQEYKDKYKHIPKILMTSTSMVRSEYEPILKGDNDWMDRVDAINGSMSYELHNKLTALFAGGWTHANPRYVNIEIENLICHDLASSYPAVMCYRTFPLTPFEKREESSTLIREYVESSNPMENREHWFARFKFKNYRSKTDNCYISGSKIMIGGRKLSSLKQSNDFEFDNGKVVKAKEFSIYLTDVDWDIVRKTADFEYEVDQLHTANKDFLPKELVEFIGNAYRRKTKYKGNDEKEDVYKASKRIANGIYGSFVLNIFKDPVIFTDGNWLKGEITEDEFYDIMEKQIKKRSPLPYQVGVWVTAWARWALWSVITKADSDVVYCDTDSVKGFGSEDLWSAIMEYNESIKKIAIETETRCGLESGFFSPESPDGENHLLGIFERDPDALVFKTLGAKRYCYSYEKFDKKTKETKILVESTIAGLPKQASDEQIKDVGDFYDGSYFNPIESHKLTCFYNNNQPMGILVTDLNGEECEINQRYGVSLVPTSFDLSRDSEYVEFLASMGARGYEDTERVDSKFNTHEILNILDTER